MTLIHCIYASRAAASFDERIIPDLLARSRERNASRGITGMLLHIDGSFFQVLEGPAHEVDALFAIISADPRHERVTQIIREPIARRSFADWSMGFETVDRADAGRILGANDFFAEASCLSRIEPGRARRLLVAFSKGRWRTDRTGEYRVRNQVA